MRKSTKERHDDEIYILVARKMQNLNEVDAVVGRVRNRRLGGKFLHYLRFEVVASVGIRLFWLEYHRQPIGDANSVEYCARLVGDSDHEQRRA